MRPHQTEFLAVVVEKRIRRARKAAHPRRKLLNLRSFKIDLFIRKGF